MKKNDNGAEYRKRYEGVLAFCSDGIILADRRGKIIEINGQITDLTDFTSKELRAITIKEIVPDDDRAIIDTVYDVLSSTSVDRGTVRLRRKTKSSISVRYTAVKISAKEYQFIIHAGPENHFEKEELIRHNKETVALHEIGKQIATSFDLDRVLPSIVNNLIWLLECQFAGVALFDASVASVSYRALVGNKAPETSQKQFDLGSEVPGIIVATKAPLLIKEFPGDPERVPGEFPVLLEEGLCTVFGVPLSFKGKVFGALVTGYRKKHEYTDDEMGLISNIANQSAIAIENARLYQASIEHSKALEMLTVRLSKIQEDERRKISRELHDTFGQALTGLHLNLDLLSSEMSTDDTSKLEIIRNMKLIINETLNDIRQIAFELRPTILDDFGIIPALRLYLHRFSRQTNIGIALKLPEKLSRRNPKVEATLYRVVQEAMTNVAKHSRAQNVSIALHSTPMVLTLEVRDDGVGFDAARLQKEEYLYEGLGLLSMRERITEVNGILRIQSEAHRGATIHIEIPLADQ
jgi:PAS domain S-box-containing protein